MKRKFGLFSVILSTLVLLVFFGGSKAVSFAYATDAVGGIDISGITIKKAAVYAEQMVLEKTENLNLRLVFEDKEFSLKANELKLKNFESVVKQAKQDALGTNFFDRINIFKIRSKQIVVPYINFFEGIDSKIEQIKTEIEREMEEPRISFKPTQKTMFSADAGIIGVKLNQNVLYEQIKQAFDKFESSTITIPVFLTPPTKTAKQVVEDIGLRSSFSTNYSSSVDGRRHNVLLSLKAFNGLVVKPKEVVSLNEILEQIPAKNFQVAKIIVNGEFVDGRGGGMCQASTTLYNALLLSDIEVLKSHSHSLPVGYVKFGFDAMVNPPGADLVFVNSSEAPIYIKTYGDKNDCFVEIYGKRLPKGLEIKRRSENIGTLKHQGDKIFADTSGKYTDKILFKGEFYRVKYPQNGYEAKSYLDYYIDGELVEEKYLRYSRYNAQQGIVYEGTEELIDGFDALVETATYPYKNPANVEEEATMTAEQIEELMKKVQPPQYSLRLANM